MIWGIAVWFGAFLLFVVVMFLALKVLQMVDTIMSKSEDRGNKYWIFTFLKYFPFFVIIIPIINLISDIVMGAEGIEDMAISSMAYQKLIVEQAPVVGGFIIVWTILYVLTLVAFEDSEVNR